MSNPVQVVADALSEQARLKPGGEVVKYARIAVAALQEAGALMPEEARELRTERDELAEEWSAREAAETDRFLDAVVHSAAPTPVAHVGVVHERLLRRIETSPCPDCDVMCCTADQHALAVSERTIALLQEVREVLGENADHDSAECPPCNEEGPCVEAVAAYLVSKIDEALS